MLCNALGRGCVVCVNIMLVCFRVVGHVLENFTLYSRGVPCSLLVLTKMLYRSSMLGARFLIFFLNFKSLIPWGDLRLWMHMMEVNWFHACVDNLAIPACDCIEWSLVIS